jgi:hypothetical protein
MSTSVAPAMAVEVATSSDKSYLIPIDESFEEYSKYLADLLCNRAQWTKVPTAVQEIRNNCRLWLAGKIPNVEEAIADAASRPLIEVRIPAAAPEAARRFPWEFVLSEVTEDQRKSRRPVLVVRCLLRGGVPPGPAPRPPAGADVHVTIICSEPGSLAGAYSFDDEVNLVRSSFAADPSGEIRTPDMPTLPPAVVELLKDPALADITERIAAQRSDVVHFAGFDAWQGARRLNWTAMQDGTPVQDGVVLQDGTSAPKIEPAAAIAHAVCAKYAPTVVGFNLYYSSTNTAALTVAQGADAAIGFQDEIDDAVAERFFALFYDVWYQTRDLFASYQAAFQGVMQGQEGLRGSGIVLWSAVSLIAQTRTAKAKPRPFPLLQPESVTDPRTVIAVDLSPCTRLNYSMLHNNRPLFDDFRIKRQGRGAVQGVRVEVVLHAGTEKSTYAGAFDLTEWEPVVNVNPHVRVSLTSELARSLQESVYSSILVSVMWGEHILLEETYRVALLPTDQWQDDDWNRVWLPSFVLPRDPAIARLIDAAQRYLTVIADRGDAGFDGYQSVTNAGGTIDYSGVDAQVQAVWWALILEYRLAYINPPPTFTQSAQRLRTPTDCIGGKRGTCIDLALLLAAALEYVEIYPVLFLLEGHAFPGYCRSETAHDNLMKLLGKVPPGASLTTNPAALRRMPEVASDWIVDQRYYADVLRMAQAGEIVPIETTMVAGACGFAAAVTQGIENLRSRSDFQYLVDVAHARERGVTPIPRWSSQ